MPIINQIVKGGGTTPTGTLQITTNGTHDVTNYATADVQVPTTAPAHYIERKVDANGVLSAQGITTPIDLTGVTKLGAAALTCAYYNDTSLTQLPDLSHITEIGDLALQYAFYQCTGITAGEIDLSSLQTINGNYAIQYCFAKCNATGLNIKNLQNVAGSGALQNAFRENSIITVQFQSLKTLSSTWNLMQQVFTNNPLQDIWFYALTSAGGNSTWSGMLQGVTGCTVHFPMSQQSTMSAWSNVTNGLGGTSTTVLFDLVQTLTGADSNTYTRQEKDSTSTATAWVYNDTLYYTSGVSNHTAGVNEPQVSDTIYSDAACTTAVTTISAIA